MTVEQLPYLAGGFVVGAAAGGLYLLLLHYTVRKLAAERKAGWMFWSAPLRMAIPVLALVLVAAWDEMALLGGAAGLLLMQIGAQLFVRSKRGSGT